MAVLPSPHRKNSRVELGVTTIEGGPLLEGLVVPGTLATSASSGPSSPYQLRCAGAWGKRPQFKRAEELCKYSLPFRLRGPEPSRIQLIVSLGPQCAHGPQAHTSFPMMLGHKKASSDFVGGGGVKFYLILFYFLKFVFYCLGMGGCSGSLSFFFFFCYYFFFILSVKKPQFKRVSSVYSHRCSQAAKITKHAQSTGGTSYTTSLLHL